MCCVIVAVVLSDNFVTLSQSHDTLSFTGSNSVQINFLSTRQRFHVNLHVVPYACLNCPGPRGRLLGDTDHPGLCTGGGTGGELQ